MDKDIREKNERKCITYSFPHHMPDTTAGDTVETQTVPRPNAASILAREIDNEQIRAITSIFSGNEKCYKTLNNSRK